MNTTTIEDTVQKRAPNQELDKDTYFDSYKSNLKNVALGFCSGSFLVGTGIAICLATKNVEELNNLPIVTYSSIWMPLTGFVFIQEAISDFSRAKYDHTKMNASRMTSNQFNHPIYDFLFQDVTEVYASLKKRVGRRTYG